MRKVTLTSRDGPRRRDGSDHPGQRRGPHPAEHLRSPLADRAQHRHRRRAGRRRDHLDRRDRQAVHPGRGRRPDQHRRRRPRRRTRHRPARPRGLPQARRTGGKPSFGFVNGLALGGGLEVALHCDLPHRDGLRAGSRPARGHARPGPRLGRRLPRAEPGRCRQGRHADPREPAQQRQDVGRPGGVRLRSGRRDASPAPTSWSSRCSGPVDVLNGAVTVERPEIDRGEALGCRGGQGCRRGPGPHRRRQPGSRQGRRADRTGEDRHPRRGLRGGGRRARGDVEDARADRQPLRLRPGAEAGQAAGRRPGQGAGPPGHQGRHRRRRPDGQPARAALPAPPRGAGRADRPRPGAGRQGCGLRPRRDRQAARQGPDQPGQARTASRVWSPAPSTSRTSSPTPTS